MTGWNRQRPRRAAGQGLAAACLAAILPIAAAAQETAGGAGEDIARPAEIAADPASDDPVARGRYVFDAAGCAGCHTEDAADALPLAGGRALETPFGTFYGPNITPDAEHGIGRWTEEDFRRALREGRSPEGHAYFPVFPYTSYTAMTDGDVADLWAYLQAVPASDRPNTPHEVGAPFGWRWLLPVWRVLNFEEGQEAIAFAGAEPDDRGAYLAEALAHCGQCHTPRGPLGGFDFDLYLAGWAEGPEGEAVPNITPHPEAGIGDWTMSDLTFLLELGMTPEGDFVGGSMNEVIQNTTSRLTPEDRQALAKYILSVPASDHRP